MGDGDGDGDGDREWHTIIGAVFGIAGDTVVGGRKEDRHAL